YSPAQEQTGCAAAVPGPHRDARVGLREPRARLCLPGEVPLPVVDVEAVLERRVTSPERVAAAHDVEIRVPVAVGIEKRRGDVLGQAIGLQCRLRASAERAVPLLDEELA